MPRKPKKILSPANKKVNRQPLKAPQSQKMNDRIYSMQSLSDKLKSLGVKVGAGDLPAPRPSDLNTIEQVLAGRWLPTSQGETFIVEERFPPGHWHGSRPLGMTASLDRLADWAGYDAIRTMPAGSIAFIDTETTGLSGGTGTYTFLIGAGRFEGEDFHLVQFFMRDPTEEPAQLMALEEFLAPCQAIVTFNGKSFDVPLLTARYIAQGWRPPFGSLAHIDLLHLSRRLWRDRLPSRTLANLEVQILGAARTQEDVPGWMIPELYFDFLRDGDARPLKRVFYHNAMDVVSLASLLNHTASLLNDPVGQGSEFGVDLIALAKLFEDLGDTNTAARLYLHSLEHEDAKTRRMPKSALLEAIQRLALIHKHREEWQEAIHLWEEGARYSHLDAFVELAKCYEHRLKDLNLAVYWTKSAIELLQVTSVNSGETLVLSDYERREWLSNLERRLIRLQQKVSGSK